MRAQFVAQRGKGIGSILSSIFRAVVPVASKIGQSILKSPVTRGVLQSAKDSALAAAADLATDALRGNDIKEGLQRNLEKAKHRVADVIDPQISAVPSSKPRPARRVYRVSQSKRRKRKRKMTQDLFDAE